jgi:hypothetical protein
LLPVSRLKLTLREPTGEDELFVVETRLRPLPAAFELVQRVAVHAEHERRVDWDDLAVSDLQALVLHLRQAWLGDAVWADTDCPAAGCGERIDVSFGIHDYLTHHRPRTPRGLVPSPDGPWYELAGAPVRFRLPTVGDLLAATNADRGTASLTERCVEPAELSPALARRVDRALSALAPSLDGLVGGTCPACARELTLRFEPISYVLAELRQAFADVVTETHALASAYGWSEAVILALPRRRRRRYAALVAEERSVA